MVEYLLDWIDKVIFLIIEFIIIYVECNRFKESICRIFYLGKKVGLVIKLSIDVDFIKLYLS